MNIQLPMEMEDMMEVPPPNQCHQIPSREYQLEQDDGQDNYIINERMVSDVRTTETSYYEAYTTRESGGLCDEGIWW